MTQFNFHSFFFFFFNQFLLFFNSNTFLCSSVGVQLVRQWQDVVQRRANGVDRLECLNVQIQFPDLFIRLFPFLWFEFLLLYCSIDASTEANRTKRQERSHFMIIFCDYQPNMCVCQWHISNTFFGLQFSWTVILPLISIHSVPFTFTSYQKYSIC